MESGMQQKHRKQIMLKLSELIAHTDYTSLMDSCIRTGLLSRLMREKIEAFDSICLGEDEQRRAQHKKLFIKLTKRGPDAYEKLKSLCRQLGYDRALSLLNETDVEDAEFQSIRENRLMARVNQNNISNTKSTSTTTTTASIDADGGCTSRLNLSDDCPILEEYKGAKNPNKQQTVIKSKCMQKHATLGHYKMCSKDHRGVLFLANIIDFPKVEDRRNGAEQDTLALIHLFSEIGFKIFAYTNLRKNDFFKLLEQLLKSDYVQQTECFTLALMTHGEVSAGTEYVQFHDGGLAKVNDIIDLFENKSCPHLLHKPKVLIFPFCRGKGLDYGYYTKMSKNETFQRRSLRRVETDASFDYDDDELSEHVSTRMDMLICFASVRGYETHRDPEFGSWYVQIFYEQMAIHAHDTSFEEIVKLTQAALTSKRSDYKSLQTGSYVNDGMNKVLYLNPGWHEEK